MASSITPDAVSVTVTAVGDKAKAALTNTADEQLYDIVKVYVGGQYRGFEYVVIDPGETKTLGMSLAKADDDALLVLTTNEPDTGVFFESALSDLSGPE